LVVESLLDRCGCAALRSFKLWIRGNTFGPYVYANNLSREFVVNYNNRTAPIGFDPNHLLARVDPTYQPIDRSDRKDVLSILAFKCPLVLEELRIPLQSKSDSRMCSDWLRGDGVSTLSAVSLPAFRNLRTLSVSMGSPLEVLQAVANLPKLKKFAWTSNRMGIVESYDYLESSRYVLSSASLEIVEIHIGKCVFLADIRCPRLRQLTHDGGYGGGVLSGCDAGNTMFWFDGGSDSINWGKTVEKRCIVSRGVRRFMVGFGGLKNDACYGQHYEEVDACDREVDHDHDPRQRQYRAVFTELELPADCTVNTENPHG
jgi:hypothetical protein